MPRRQRTGMAGLIFHVINRGARRTALFDTDADYAAFEDLLIDVRAEMQIPLLAYCLMPNHWHLVLWPERDDDLSSFMKRLAGTHALRWNAAHHCLGTGAVYQGRFKAIPVQADLHFLRLCRYVERNPVRAGLVAAAAEWRWSSLWRRLHRCDHRLLSRWPMPVPAAWLDALQESPPDDDHTDQIRQSIRGNLPFGGHTWCESTVERLGIAGRGGRGRPAANGSQKCTRPRSTGT
jgi:putative transposase